MFTTAHADPNHPASQPTLPPLSAHDAARLFAITHHQLDLYAAAAELHINPQDLAVFASRPDIAQHLKFNRELLLARLETNALETLNNCLLASRDPDRQADRQTQEARRGATTVLRYISTARLLDAPKRTARPSRPEGPGHAPVPKQHAATSSFRSHTEPPTSTDADPTDGQAGCDTPDPVAHIPSTPIAPPPSEQRTSTSATQPTFNPTAPDATPCSDAAPNALEPAPTPSSLRT
jgi:hypothetical protein